MNTMRRQPEIPQGQPVGIASPDEVYNVICAAASQDPSQIKASSERLKQLFDMTGTFDALSEIAAQRTLPLQVRQQSIIQLKNSALGHWRSRKLLSEEQRARIRARCMGLLDEPDDLIAECNEVILSKIARYEYPHSWPTFLNDLLTLIDTNMGIRYGRTSTDPLPPLLLRRSLEVLNATLKEFINMKMLTGVKTMARIAQQIHTGFQNYYSTAAVPFASLDPSTVSSPRTAEDLLIAHLIFKCVVKLATWAWPRSKTENFTYLDPWLRTLFQNCAMQLQNLSELRINLVLALRSGTVPATPNTELTIKNLTRHIFLFGKFFRRLQQLDVARFVTLPISSDLILYYWNKVVQATNSPREYTEDSSTAVFPVRFLVQAMALFKDSLAQWAPVRKDGSENVQVLSQAFVEDAVRLLVTRFIPLDPSDLEEWMSDPEEWVNLEEKENEQWEYELRPCGERVLMTLAYQYRQYVIPLLLTTFEQIVAQPTVDLPSILQKEALYCAIGRCAQRMKEVIPFDQWLENSLISETRETNTGYPIIKRRIAWLIGKWISGQCSSPNNPKIWEVLVYLLQDRGPGTDAVVRLTAAVALRECVDTIEFQLDVFAPYLPLAVTELVKLIAEADTLESKRRICNSLNTVIERSETQIVPLLGIVVEPLPQLWTAAGTDWLFKSALLETVTKLIESSKGHSAALSDFVVPLIRESFEPEARIQLDEDALMLWQVALRHTESLDGSDGRPGLASLIRLAVDLLANNLDLLGQIISILESYVILDASRVLQECTVDMFTAMEKAMNQAVQVNVKETATVLGLVVQLAPSNLWGEALHHSKLFAFLVKSIEEDKASTTLLTEYVLVLARIALVDRQMFLQLMSASAPALGFSEHRIWELTLDGWWTRFDNMSEPRHRKVAAMGIANLVATGHPEVLERLPSEICNMWLDVFAELREAQSSDRSNPSLFLYWDKAPDSFYHGSEGTAEYNRRKTIYNNDPARTIQLTSYIAARLQEAEAASGGSAALQAKYLAKADPAVLKEIHAELTGQNPGNSS